MSPKHDAGAAIDEDQNRNSGCKATLRRATSVPVTRRENPRLESLRLRKQSSFLDVQDTPSSSLPTNVNESPRPTRPITAARGRKRGPSPRATPQTDLSASTSVSATEPIAENEQRPRKRRKRSSVPPAQASSSQSSAPSQSRRRTRSRVGSPVTDVEYVPPLRVSARLARKTHPLIKYRSLDIYTHLADPDGAGNLLSEPSTNSVVLSTSKDTSCSQSVAKPRGRRRKTIDLGDEVTKRNLMEEWAQLRQSQGALSLSGIDQNACPSEILLRDAQNGDASVQLRSTVQEKSLVPDLVESQATTVAGTSQSEDTVVNVPSNKSSLVPMDIGDGSPAMPDASDNRLDHNGSVPPDGETDQSIVPGKGVEALSIPVTDLRVDEDFPNDESVGTPDLACHHEMLQLSSPPVPSTLASRDGPVHAMHGKQKTSSINNTLKDSHSVNVSQMSSLDDGTIHLDFEEEFYMLDIPEMFTLPWVPVSSNLYVPPGLGKLISGMREQLTMATRARRRAEELYQAELSRRISAEKVVEKLQTGLEERQNGRSVCWTSRRRRASSAPCQRNSNPAAPRAA